MHTTIAIPPLPPAFLDKARSQRLDDQNQPVRVLRAEGGEPLRDVLRRALPGEELILASFTPFTVSGPYREFGPVFLLANPSEEEANRAALPLNGYLRERFVIRAYSPNEEILDAAMVTGDDAAPVIDRLLERSDVAFLHARFPTYGCFALRIDRA